MDGMKIAVPMGSNFLKTSHGVLDLRSGEDRPMERVRKKLLVYTISNFSSTRSPNSVYLL